MTRRNVESCSEKGRLSSPFEHTGSILPAAASRHTKVYIVHYDHRSLH